MAKNTAVGQHGFTYIFTNRPYYSAVVTKGITHETWLKFK